MRDGRRTRLGLVDGTEGTVQDTYLDRILSDVDVAGEPNILNIDPDANVRTTDQRYLQDAYKYFLGGGFPEETIAADTAQIPEAVDTLIDTGGGGGGGGSDVMDQLGTVDTGITASGVVAPTVEQTAATEDIGATTTIKDILDDQYEFENAKTQQLRPTSNIAPTVEQTAAMEDIGATDTIESLTAANIPTDYEAEAYGAPDTIESLTEPNLIDIGRDKIDEIGQSISNALGTAYDAFNTTIDIAGKKINLASTAAKAVLNKYIGGPISVVIDALGAMDLPGGPTLQTSKAQSIGLAGEGQYQDKYGINTQSALGDYDKYNVDRVAELEGIVASQIARDKKNTIQMKELKDRQEYNTISGVGGDVEGDQPGMTKAEEIGLQDRIDPGLRVGEKEDIVDAPVDIVDVEAVEEMIENAKIEAEAVKDTVRPGDVDFSQERTDENISQAVDDLAAQYDAQVESGQRQEDATTTSKVNKAKEMIGMPQQLGDVGQGSPMGGPTGAPTGISGPPSRGGTATTGPSAPPGQGGGGGTGGGGKVVCTMMNESYGFGSFRNKIWLRQSKNLAPEYQKGYHKIFLPLVKLSKKNIVLKKILEHIAIHRTIDIRQEARGKRHLLGRIYRRILEPICYWVGKNA